VCLGVFFFKNPQAGRQRVNDAGWCGIPCYMLLHHVEVLSFNCGLSVAKYQHWFLAMKNKNIGIGPKKPY